MSDEIKVRSSSRNVFADIGMANSEDLLIKAEIAVLVWQRRKKHPPRADYATGATDLVYLRLEKISFEQVSDVAWPANL